MKTTELLKKSVNEGKVDSTVQTYVERFEEDGAVTIDDRLKDAAEINKHFYDLVTDFYLHAWGKMFHFGARKKGEGLKDSLIRHELFLADKLELSEEDQCLDIGCGVGGPMINIAKKTNARITGINNNTYQIKKGEGFLKKDILHTTCSFVECDWMDIPLPNESFDKAYTIEATCHAADKRVDVYKEINRLLKPDALFAGYDWVLTGHYDVNNPLHRKLKHEIEIGNGILNLNFTQDVTKALEQAGFEVLECCDKAEECDPETPWYLPLKGENSSMKMIRMSPVGRVVMRNIFRLLEAVRILPKGTLKVSQLLNIAGEALVKAGEEKIFTPMLFFLARKKN